MTTLTTQIGRLASVHKLPHHKARFLMRALLARSAAASLLQAKPGSLLYNTIEQRPSTLDIIESPYIVASWSPEQRVSHFIEHMKQIEALGDFGNFNLSASICLSRLYSINDRLSIVLDKPSWFRREGVLAINLFQDQTRVYSIAFSVTREPQDAVVIGGIQGRDIPGILDIYRDITKEAYGLRPRDLLLEALKMVARGVGASRILAVADEERHHRASYFSGKSIDHTNYNDIWIDRGGRRLNPIFYDIPISTQHRDIDTVAARKRSTYRKRYAFLDTLELSLVQKCAALIAR